VCDDPTQLPFIASEIMLNEKYFIQTNNTTHNPVNTDIIILISYLNHLQQELLLGLLDERRDYSIVVLNYNGERLRDTYQQHLVQAVSGMESNEKSLMQQIEFFNWQHIGLVALISHDDCVYFEYFKSILNRLHDLKHICFFAQYINTSANAFDMKKTTDNLISESHLNVTILFGHPYHQYKLIENLESVVLTKDRLWVAHEIRTIPSFTDLFISNYNIF